ncbi:hypothetical protein DRQ53_10905 [bacterium]|nr:MAG: hypothetical protein DRQ32_08335 [bacterium]RKZ14703.1 MAG: hypothetical protein DRQ53_10905 [bacterium]
MIKPTFALLLSLWACASVPHRADAFTWAVEQDGSGDFTIIQDALDAAAPGDSILIGPGRFDTFRPGVSVVDGYRFSAIAWVRTPDLTLIGSGRDSTVLGPLVPVLEVDGQYSCSLYIDGGAPTHVEALGLDNTALPGTIRAQSVMDACRVTREPLLRSYGVATGVVAGIEIRNTQFRGPNGVITAAATESLTIEDCEFEDDSLEGTAVMIGNGGTNCVVRRCSIRGGSTGVAFGFGGSGVVEDCDLQGMSFSGINVDSGTAVIRRCVIGATRQTLRVNVASVEVSDCVLEGGTQATIATWGTLVVRTSHILNSGVAPTVLGWTSAPGNTVDLRHNWWGTADVEQIEAWIDNRYGTVLWQPIADAVVPTESSSMSALKGNFKRD